MHDRIYEIMHLATPTSNYFHSPSVPSVHAGAVIILRCKAHPHDLRMRLQAARPGCGTLLGASGVNGAFVFPGSAFEYEIAPRAIGTGRHRGSRQQFQTWT